jgi:hypothetical protein
MALDYFDLAKMRASHPAWRLMAADNAPLIAAFLDTAFRESNLRQLSESELSMRLDDFLYHLRAGEGEGHFPRSGKEYLDEWARNERGWLRKFYPQGSDEAHYDLTPATERALQWLEGLFESSFVGTESRLYTLFHLLKEIVHGVETDRGVRVERLKKQRDEIDREIAAVEAGEVTLLDERGLKERFFQFGRMARELLSDFRAVEHNFRELDRSVREQIASWSGEKSALLKKIFGEHDAITRSDQGQSFRAFWDFLMSPSSQEELSELLDGVYGIQELGDALEDQRLRRIHFDWMIAGEQTQRTVARLSGQLRSYLDDRAFYEHRRIIELLDSIEKRALSVRGAVPRGDVMEIEGWKPDILLPLVRPLFSPPLKTDLSTMIETADASELDASALFNQVFVDKARLLGQIEEHLRSESQVSLKQVLSRTPLEEGLTELVAYFSIASESRYATIDESVNEEVAWRDRDGQMRRARIPLLLFHRKE